MGTTYCLTRLGFGLNAALNIMTSIIRCVNKVLSIDGEVRAGTDSYIDDIVVNELVVPRSRVVELLQKYGFTSNPAEQFDGARVLGIQVTAVGDHLRWASDNKMVMVNSVLTKTQAFSWCGQLLGVSPWWVG